MKDKKLTGYPSIENRHNANTTFFSRHPFIPNLSIYNTVKLLSRSYRNEIAVDCDEVLLTYYQLFEMARLLARAFLAAGVKKGDIVSVVLPNNWLAIALFFAANKIGAVLTFINTASSASEVKRYVTRYNSPLLFVFDKSSEYTDELVRDTGVKLVVSVQEEDVKTTQQAGLSGEVSDRAISYGQFLAKGNDYRGKEHTVMGGSLNAIILYTSGSTGEPKSVVLTNRNVIASGIYQKNTIQVKPKPGERCLACVPFCYPYGFLISVIMALLCGRTSVLTPSLSASTADYYVRKKPNYIFGSPAILEFLQRNCSPDIDMSSVHTFVSGGDFLPNAQMLRGKQFFREHNSTAEICNGSGNAEACGVITEPVGSVIKADRVGKPLTGTKAIIVDPDTLEELRYGEEGMLCSAGKHIFKEYYGEPELTKATKFIYKGNTYLKTGTMGILDDEGFFALTGRVSRFYCRSDFHKVYCANLQKIINTFPYVDSNAVVKKPDEENLFVSIAFVVLKDGYQPNDEMRSAIYEFLDEVLNESHADSALQIKPYEIPSEIVFLSSLPRNVADKIDYIALEKLAAAECGCILPA